MFKMNSKLIPDSIDKLRPIILYDNSGGALSVNLNDSADNYSYIEIYYKTNDDFYNYTKVASPNGKKVFLIGAWINTNGSTALKMKIVTINGRSIAPTDAYKYGNFGVGGNTSKSAEDLIYITKVVGYK